MGDKTTRAANMRSSIYEGGDGRWHGWVTMGIKDDGSLDRRHRSAKTEKAVTRKVQQLERDRDAGRIAKVGPSMTVQQWITTYLDTIAIRSLGPKTWDSYRSLARSWIIPGLGQHRLNRLAPDHLDKLYMKMARAGKAESTVLKVHRIISRSLEIAVRRGLVTRNVAKLVDAPSLHSSEIAPFEQEEARRLLKATVDRRNGVRWSVGLALGLRQGEALGLRWKYVDLETGSVRIWWQLQRVTWRHGCSDPHACGADKHHGACKPGCRRHAKRRRGCPPPCPPDCTRHASTCPQRQRGGLVFRAPKGKSKRTVQLPPALIELLKEHRERQQQERGAVGDKWEDNDLVFCEANGAKIDPRRDWDDWKDLLRVAGVRDARVHDGRHTSATLLIEQGVHVRVVQEILGHSDIRLTQRYTHVATAAAKDAADLMGQALWGPAK